MDISKASNFERFVYDIVDRDPATVRTLWHTLATDGGFDLAGTPYWEKVRAAGFLSGRSTHADRVATIRDIEQRYGVVVDPHTADGLKVGREQRDPKVPLVCIETALPVKFSATIVEALGREPHRPEAYVGIEAQPQRFTVLPARVELLKAFIEGRAAAA
jgi:threonine synthase